MQTIRIIPSLLTLVLSVFWASATFAQSPEAFNYQAVVRDASGNVLPNQAVSFRMHLRAGSATGTTVYSETHAATTNAFGLVNLQIGQGTPVSGTFSAIDWANDSHFIEIELDPAGGSNYTALGTQQLISVPYALHATTVENDAVDDADADPNNELQALSLSGDTLSISNGNSIQLPQVVDTDDQTLSISNDSLLIQDGNAVDLSAYLDNTDAQVISRSNDTLFLSNGGFAVLPPQTVDTDDQTLSISNDSLIIQDGNAVDLSAYLDNTDAQVISRSNDTLFLSNGGFAILPTDQVNDADADPNNEIQALSISNDTLFLTNGGFAVLPPGTVDTDDQTLSISNDSLLIADGNGVDLSSYLDNTDAQVISRSNDTLFLSNGGFAVLPPQTVDTDDQTLSLSNDSLIIQDGNAVDLSAYLDNTDAQVISRSNDTLFLSNGGFAVLPPQTVDTDDQTLSLSNDSLFIQNGNAVDLGFLNVALKDGDADTQVEVEANPDEDMIRFTLAGTERYRMEETSTGQVFLDVNSPSLMIGRGKSDSITGGVNTLIGTDAGLTMSSGQYNTLIGVAAGRKLTTGSYNTFMGVAAGFEHGQGICNTFIGYHAGRNHASGVENTFLGAWAGRNCTTGERNVFVGFNAGRNETGNDKLYIDNSGSTSPLIYGEFNNDILAINGNLGVGETNPQTSLDVVDQAVIGDLAVGNESTDQGTSNLAGLGFTTTPWLYTNAIEAQDERGPSSTLITVGNDGTYGSADEIHLVTGGDSRLHVQSNGDVGIGENNPDSRLHVKKNLTGIGQYLVTIQNTGNGAYANGLLIQAGENAQTVNNRFISFANPLGFEIGAIRQIGNTTMQYNTTSDRRLKTNIQPTRFGLKDLMGIEVMDYSFKSELNKTRTGFIAQQLHEKYPEAVSVGGEDLKTDPWMVDYGQVTPLLVKSMQEQQEIIEEQKNQIEEQKQMLEALTRRLEALEAK
jgi:hypothetical protein